MSNPLVMRCSQANTSTLLKTVPSFTSPSETLERTSSRLMKLVPMRLKVSSSTCRSSPTRFVQENGRVTPERLLIPLLTSVSEDPILDPSWLPRHSSPMERRDSRCTSFQTSTELTSPKLPRLATPKLRSSSSLQRLSPPKRPSPTLNPLVNGSSNPLPM